MTRIKILPPKPDKELIITFRYTPLAIKEKQDSDKEDRAERVALALEEYKKQQSSRKDSVNSGSNLTSGSASVRSEAGNGGGDNEDETQTNGNGNGHGIGYEGKDESEKVIDTVNDQDSGLGMDSERILSQTTSPIEEEYYSNLDKGLYPFSSKYTPKNFEVVKSNGEKTNQIINIDSLLLHQLGDYMQIDSKTESKWKDESRQVIESLRNWRRLYKILDYKKRQIKKSRGISLTSSNSSFKDKESLGENHSSNDSSNGAEESEETSSDGNNAKSTKVSVKRRKTSGNQGLEITMNGGNPTIDSRKTRSTRSGR